MKVTFRDNGIGILKENVSKIFDFGFTITSGAGLGLFHVKNIIQKLGWDIQFNPKNKSGAEFNLMIKK